MSVTVSGRAPMAAGAMPNLQPDPLKALALLPDVADARAEREWLQQAIAWLLDLPPERRTERLRLLADGILLDAYARERFAAIWARVRPARLFSEAGLPEATSLPRELLGSVNK